jgi:phenylacetate-CoA ligase
MLIIRGVNVFPTQIETQICAIKGLTPHYQIEVGKKGNMDTIKVQVELAPEAVNEDYDELVRKLNHKIKTFIGISCAIELKQPHEIPRSEGKAQRVIDKRKA